MATGEIAESDYQDLRQTVIALEQRVMSLETRLEADDQQPFANPNIRGLEEGILRITKEVFPGDAAIEITNDSEYPQDSYTVVRTQASGEIQAIEDRRIEWHERVTQLSDSCRLLRLSLDYRP